MSNYETIDAAMAMMDRPQTISNRRRFFAMALAAITGFVVGQIVVLEDGTQAVVELAEPSPVHAVIRRDRHETVIKSLHWTAQEAKERVEGEEWRQMLQERSDSGKRLQ